MVYINMVDRKSYVSNTPDKDDNNTNSTTKTSDDYNTCANTITESETSLPSSTVELDIKDIEGIGPTTAKKLKEAGIVSVMDLAVTSAEELAVDINASKESAAAFVIAAQKLLRDSKVLEKEFVTADAALEKRRSMLRCSTGSSALDDLLLGGIETQAVTEFYGEFGSGKSQICHTLCVMARQPVEEGGLDGNTILIDTEGTFRPERIDQIARARGLDSEEVLKNIHIAKAYNSSHLELLVKDIGKFIEQFNAKLIIIDSIIS